MAERTLTIRECDRLSCRKRKGVALVEVVLTITEPGEAEPQVFQHKGDLCPTHATLTLKQAKAWFVSTNKE